MPVFEPFFKRQGIQRGEYSHDVYQYDTLSTKVRKQILWIIQNYIEDEEKYLISQIPNLIYNRARNIMCQELGVKNLYELKYKNLNAFEEIYHFIENEENIELVLSVFELLILGLKEYKSQLYLNALKTFNTRMKENGVGYCIESDVLIRIDNQILHHDIIVPALNLLVNPEFKSANSEFLMAHTLYRSGDYEQCLVECQKSLESTLKIICVSNSWASNTDTMNVLVAACFNNELIPKYWQSLFSGLRTTLDSGVNVARNKQGGHGAGTVEHNVPDHLAAYVMHMTASAIVFLVEADKRLKG